jgi:hypothetical protein
MIPCLQAEFYHRLNRPSRVSDATARCVSQQGRDIPLCLTAVVRHNRLFALQRVAYQVKFNQPAEVDLVVQTTLMGGGSLQCGKPGLKIYTWRQA